MTLVHRAFFEGQFPGHRPDEPAAWLADVISAFVAERDGEIVGHVAVACAEVHGETGLRWREMTGHPAEELGVVGQLFVRPRFRGHGIGTSLVTTGDRRRPGPRPGAGARGRHPRTAGAAAGARARMAPAQLRAVPGPSDDLWVHRLEAPPAY